MRLWHILLSRLRSLFLGARREADLRDELQFHVERETERLEAEGMNSNAARLQALRTFGAVEPTKEACRDTRGVGLADDLARDVRYACRSFRRAPLVALTIVTTVGLGLGLVAAVFTLLSMYLFRVDEVRNPNELFAVERQRALGEGPEGFTRAQFDSFLRETDVFSGAFAMAPEVDSWIDGRRMDGTLASGNFFQVLGVSAARGRTFSAIDDTPGGPPVIVLSHRAWSQEFAGDEGILNRNVLLNGTRVHVVGVMPDGFRGLMVAPPDFWAPLSLLTELQRVNEGNAGSARIDIVGRLKPSLPRDQALARLLVWDARHAAERPGERPAARLVLERRRGTIPQPVETVMLFVPLFFAFGLILLIGCANVANLLLARAVARQREIGIRLAIGASRRRVIWQLLTESLLLALVSAALGWGISRAVLEAVVYTAMATWQPGFGDLTVDVPPADWRVALFLVAGAIVSTFFFALVPAFQATRLELVRATRGEVMRDASPGRARDVLVALQVTASALLLICAGVFLRSSWTASTYDPGIRTADTVNVSILNEQRRGAVLEAVRAEPSVDLVAASWPGGFGGLGGRDALAEGPAGKAAVRYQFVSPEFFSVLGIGLVRGRGFAPVERDATAAVAIVSERVAEQLWPGRDAIGQVVRVERDPKSQTQERDRDAPQLASRSLVVIGVAQDVAGFRLGGMRLAGAGVYLPITPEAAMTSLTMRVRNDPDLVRRALVDRMAAVDPNMAEVTPLRVIASLETFLLKVPFWLTLVLGALALLLTVSGLFSVLSYLVEQRRREIGVRVALGATSGRIGALVLSQSGRPVGFGLLLGTGLTGALSAVLLATPAAEAIGSTVRLFDPIAYGASLLCIVTACACTTLIPALRAARVDPVGALRQD